MRKYVYVCTIYLLLVQLNSFQIIVLITYIFKVKESNEEWNRCLDTNGVILGRCVYECGENEECRNQCVNEFDERQLNCPCEASTQIYLVK